MAPAKTEAVFLNGKKPCPKVEIILQGHPVSISDSVRYLGVTLDKGLTGAKHIQQAAARAAAVGRDISRLLPLKNTASDVKRRLLASVAENIITYAAPVWRETAGKGVNSRLLDRTQRPINIRLARANRTVSTAAACVLALQLPWSLLVAARGKQPSHKEDIRMSVDSPRPIDEAWEIWSKIWSDIQEGEPGFWTKTLIPNPKTWLATKGSLLSYPLTQLLTGHGSFSQYLHRIGRSSDPGCVACLSGEEDDVRHTFESCPAFTLERTALLAVLQLPPPLKCEQMATALLDSPWAWDPIRAFVGDIIQKKTGLISLSLPKAP